MPNTPVRTGQVWQLDHNWGLPGLGLDAGSKFIIGKLLARAGDLVPPNPIWVGNLQRGCSGERHFSDLFEIQFLNRRDMACAEWINENAHLVDAPEHPEPARALHSSGPEIRGETD